MIRSLYVRIVLLFLVVFVVSLSAGFFTAIRLYSYSFLQSFEEELLADGKHIISIYKRGPEIGVEDFLSEVAKLEKYDIMLVWPDGRRVFFSGRNEASPPELSQDAADRVLRGGVYRGLTESVGPRGPDGGVGLPFELQEARLGVFLFPSLQEEAAAFRLVMATVLGVVLLVGSLLFLFAANHIVRPLRALTAATVRLSKGDFNVQVPVPKHSRDELGTLAKSFNTMAGELKQLDALRQDFITNVSHEFQTPLTSIRGFAQAMRDHELPPETRHSYISIISEESERLSRLTDSLLRLAALEREDMQLRLTRFSLDNQVMRAVIAQEPIWQAKGITVDMELDEVSLVADEDQLWQVWTNLLSNAIRFTQGGGSINIAVRDRNGETEVEIKDTGIGIAEKDIHRIFDRFYTADKSREHSREGNGLGLSIVHRIVTLHGGEVLVISGKGVGTSFTVRLPKEAVTDS